MSISIDVWALAHSYFEDEKHHLTESDQLFILGSIRSRNWRNLAEVFRDSGPEYRGLHECRVLSQISAFFKKNALYACETSCFEAAQSSFKRAEKICRITNKRLDYYFFNPDRVDSELSSTIVRMRRIIAETLGSVDLFHKKLPELVHVTSGASSTAPRHRSAPHLKVSRLIPCTKGALPYVRALSRFHTGNVPRVALTNCNRVTLVPKNSMTHRTIACEPIGNLPFQIACDGYIKTRLTRKLGIDLSSQENNRRLARIGSVSGELATIDLSMASDTLSLNLVPFLLPHDWSTALGALRSPYYKGPFGPGKYSKFSSMGNGFTFTLETLVFAALCKALGSRVYTVYGDDIIIETSRSKRLIRYLRFFGFIPNEEKSFTHGPFRESCGGDYYEGHDIRPFFIRKTRVTKAELCHIINNVVRVSSPLGKTWRWCKGYLEQFKLPLVPYSESESSGIFVDPTTAYELRLIKTTDFKRHSSWIPMYKGYASYTPTRDEMRLRSLLLWYLRKYTHGDSLIVTSEVPTGAVKTRKRWVPWHKPAGNTPDYLYWWSDYAAA
jgi:hypothetical protein